MISILIAEDEQLLIEGLKSLIDRESDLEVIAEASNGRRAVELAEQYNPEIVIMDIDMPELNGIEATRHITQTMEQVGVIGLSVHGDIKSIRRMLAAGAKGYLVKDCVFDELVTTIHAVSESELHFGSLARKLVMEDYLNQVVYNNEQEEILSGREKEVLQLLAEGHTTREIATKLEVSDKTIDSHRQNIMNKLDIHHVPGLTKYAIKHRIISLD